MRGDLTVLVFGAIAMCGCQESTPLFNGGDLTGWVEVGSTGSWSAIDGVVRCNGRRHGYAWLSTDRKYGDFELTLEWRIGPGGNSGIFCRAPDRQGRTSLKGFEVQIKDDSEEDNPADLSGAVFARVPAIGRFSKPVGHWNQYRITCRGRQLRVELNGQLVCEVHFDRTESMKDMPNEGYIGLQNHGHPVEFRDIEIREIR